MIGSVHIAHPEKAPSSNTKQISEAMLSCTKGAPEAFLRAENTPQMQYVTHHPYFDKNYQVTKLQGWLKPEGCSLGQSGYPSFPCFLNCHTNSLTSTKVLNFCTKLCPLGVINHSLGVIIVYSLEVITTLPSKGIISHTLGVLTAHPQSYS